MWTVYGVTFRIISLDILHVTELVPNRLTHCVFYIDFATLSSELV